jgi:hypothetical protein
VEDTVRLNKSWYLSGGEGKGGTWVRETDLPNDRSVFMICSKETNTGSGLEKEPLLSPIRSGTTRRHTRYRQREKRERARATSHAVRVRERFGPKPQIGHQDRSVQEGQARAPM